jgi:hypothetical protein
MTNVFEQALTKEDGTVDFSKAMSLAPDYMIRNVQSIIPWVMNMLAQTKLSEEFIRKNFAYIPFGTLIINNDVPQDVIETNIEAVFSKFIFGLGSEEFDEKVIYFFQQGYEPHVYEKIIEGCFTYFENDQLDDEVKEDIEGFSHIINAYPEIVSKEFIIHYSNDIGYMLLTAALKRDDISVEDLINHIDDISLDEITTWMAEFEDQERDEDSLFNTSNWNMLIKVFKYKAAEYE